MIGSHCGKRLLRLGESEVVDCKTKQVIKPMHVVWKCMVCGKRFEQRVRRPQAVTNA